MKFQIGDRVSIPAGKRGIIESVKDVGKGYIVYEVSFGCSWATPWYEHSLELVNPLIQLAEAAE